MPFYTKSGYKLHTKEELKKNPNKQYLGYGYYHSLRYSFHYRDKIYLGLTAEKDAGEPFFAGQNRKGYDFYHILFLLLSRMKVIHIDKTFYPSTAIFQPKTLPALPVERQTYTLPILPGEAT